MKVLSESAAPADQGPSPVANLFTLPHGIIGFKDYTQAELLYVPDHLPFLWMKLQRKTGEAVHFIVIEPAGLVPGYSPELFDADAEALGLRDASEAMLLNIVTLKSQNPLEAVVNLIGPIVVNRRTREARQLVVANYSAYSAHWPLVDATANRASA